MTFQYIYVLQDFHLLVLDELVPHIAQLYRQDVFALPLDEDFNKEKGMPPMGSSFYGTTKSDHSLLCVDYEGKISRPVWSVSCFCAISPWMRQTL
jgi:hypothetical protein